MCVTCRSISRLPRSAAVAPRTVSAKVKLAVGCTSGFGEFTYRKPNRRQPAGGALLPAHGKRWGGSRKGRRLKVTAEQVQAIRRLKDEGQKIAAIARATGLSRPTIYSVLGSAAQRS